MTASLDRIAHRWRGPLMAALVALAAVLPAALTLPVTDRSEARLAEASARMIEDRDFTAAAVDDQAPDRRPLGVHWLQAASAAAVSEAEAREIWAFRLPAVAGAMAASAACAWGAAALFGAGSGLIAGALMGAGFLLSSAAVIDVSGALLCAGVTLAVSALARIRLAAETGRNAFKTGLPTHLLLWLGMALSAVSGGPIGPMVVILTGFMLWLIERRARWLAGLGWSWGLIVLAAIVGPSLVAGAIQGDNGLPDFLPFDAAGERTPGLQLLISPLLAFPFTLLLPAGLLALKRTRRELGARIALAWLLPAWIVVEFAKSQPPAGGLMFYGALTWLCALAVRDGIGPVAARLGAALQVLAAAVLIAAVLYLARRFGGAPAFGWALAASALMAAATLAGAVLLLRRRVGPALAVAGTLGVLAHSAALAGMGPHLDTLWTAKRTAAALKAAGLDPRDGVMPGPVAVTGFGEPSLTFALGGVMESLEPAEAAAAVRAGRPAIVEARQEDAFLRALPSPSMAKRVGEAEGFDYAKGSTVRLEIYGPASKP